MADTSSTFTIKEKGGQNRSLTFSGRALPYRPLKLTGKMRAEFTRYPGNPIATAQVLGAEEAPTSISGTWKDRFLKQTDDDGNYVVPDGAVEMDDGQGAAKMLADVEAIVEAVDSFRMEGQLVEVTWDSRVRHGIIVEFTQIWQRHEICEWEIGFEWISRGEAQLPINFAEAPKFALSQLSLKGAFNNLLDAVHEAIELEQSFFNKVADYTNKLSDAVDSVNDAVTSVVKSALSVTDSARRLSSIFETIKDDAEGLRNLVQSIPARVMVATEDIAEVTFGGALYAADWARRVGGYADQMRALAAQQQADLLAAFDEQEVLDIFDARQDTDLRDVSTRFFGTPDQWKSLMSYNGFLGSKLNAGDEVLIPKLRTGGQ